MPTSSRLRRIGSRRFWSATGAVLSVFATLWATLIGQTILQILASPPSSRARFLRAASHACAHLPAAPGMAVPGPGGQAELPQEATMKSADAITHIQNNFNERAPEPLELTAQDLLTLSAPAPYVTEYRAFEQMFGETAFAFDQMQQTIDRLASLGTGRGTDVYRRDLASVLNAIAGTFRQSHEAERPWLSTAATRMRPRPSTLDLLGEFAAYF